MEIKWLIFLIIFLVIEKLLEKKFPQFFKRIELPCAIVTSGIITVYCFFLLYAVYDVLTSEVSNGDKVFFSVFIGCIITVYVIIMALIWKSWNKKRKNGKK
ncbi:MAG: hypothetical protein ACOX81_09505 [Candidatus Heteroscillospira sp.]|jgi:fucose 4-O-acetylase-like acetyltransferase